MSTPTQPYVIIRGGVVVNEPPLSVIDLDFMSEPLDDLTATYALLGKDGAIADLHRVGATAVRDEVIAWARHELADYGDDALTQQLETEVADLLAQPVPAPIHVIVLTDKQVRAFDALTEDAERGWDDFEYLAGLDGGDYDKADVKRFAKWKKRQQRLIANIHRQLGRN